MREALELFSREARARIFFAALAQSALGTGAGYVALLLIAYEQWHSPWAITLVLLADLLPAMVLGPIFGAAADRWSRRKCMVVADLLRFVAFGGIALIDSIEATLALAVLAGCGTGMFTPAALASLPGLVEPRRLPAATSVYGAIADLGFTVGPALAAAILLVTGPETLLAANAVTFGISALVLARLRFGAAPEYTEIEMTRPSLISEARAGLAATAGMPGIRVVLGISAGALVFAGLFNVAELPFAQDILDAGAVGYSLLAAAFGAGFVAGSLVGARGGAPALLKKRYQVGVLLLGAGFIASGVAPNFATALGAFALGGVGNGLLLVYERLLIQAVVPNSLAGRVFGVKDALSAWAFGTAFISAGAVISLVGVRELLLLAGVGGLIAWAVSVRTLRNSFTDREAPVISPSPGSGLSGEPLRQGAAGE